jgi:hypothetical protein
MDRSGFSIAAALPFSLRKNHLDYYTPSGKLVDVLVPENPRIFFLPQALILWISIDSYLVGVESQHTI